MTVISRSSSSDQRGVLGELGRGDVDRDPARVGVARGRADPVGLAQLGEPGVLGAQLRGQRADERADDPLDLIHLLVVAEDAQHHVDPVERTHHQEEAPVEQTLGVIALDRDGLVEDRSAEGLAGGWRHRTLPASGEVV
jgi:hypothetical protein